jgi:hypothetical protein
MKAGETANLIFFAFDLLFLGDQDFRSLPLMERKKRLQGLLAENEGQKMVQLRAPGCCRQRRGSYRSGWRNALRSRWFSEHENVEPESTARCHR